MSAILVRGGPEELTDSTRTMYDLLVCAKGY